MAIIGMVDRVVGGNWLSKHALLTAFFPNLVLWSTALWLFGPDEVRSWIDPGATNPKDHPTFYAFLFIVWVMIWTFATINIQPSLVGLYRGEWTGTRFGDWLAEHRRQTWVRTVMRVADDASAVSLNQIALQEIRDVVANALTHRDDPAQRVAANSQQPPTRDEIDKDILELTTDVDHLKMHEASGGALVALRGAANKLESIRRRASGNVGLDTAAQREIDTKTAALAAGINRSIEKLEALLIAQRDRVLSAVHGRFPQSESAVAATRLGNVFRAGEEEMQLRYGLNPWLFVSHLRMVLPTGYAELLLEDAQLGLDLTITLSALLLVFGPLFAGMWVLQNEHLLVFGRVTVETPGVVAPILAGFALIALAKFVTTRSDSSTDRRRQRRPAVQTIQAKLWRLLPVILIATAFVIIGLPFALKALSSPSALWWRVLEGTALFIICSAIAIGVSLMTYSNAVDAAVVYCDGVKALFDAHRSKILTQLRLSIPSNLVDERLLWRMISDHIAGGSPPDPRYFVYVAPPTGALRPQGDLPRPQSAVVAASALPAFTKLKDEHLLSATVWPAPTDRFVLMRDCSSVVGRYITKPLAAGALIRERDLAPEKAVAGHVLTSLSIPLPALPPGVEAGAFVTFDFSARATGAISTRVFQRLLITETDIEAPQTASMTLTPLSATAAPNAGAVSPASVPPTMVAISVLLPSERATDLAACVATGGAPLVALHPLES